MTRFAVLTVSLFLLLPLANFCLADAAPATAPRVLEAAPRVLVYPFTSVGDSGAYAWVGNGIQQSLLVEVGRPGFVALMVPTSQPGEAGTDPVATAAKAGAAVAVIGSYQILNGDIRCTGQVVDTAGGQSIAALNATGPLKELFKIEDELGRQLRGALQPMARVAKTLPAPEDSYAPVVSPASGYYYSSPAETYVPATYSVPSYSYAYPAYDYAYPYYSYYPFTSSFIFVDSFRFGDHRRFDHRRFDCDDRFGRFHNGGFRGGVSVGAGFAQRPPVARFGGVGGNIGFRGSFGAPSRGPVMQGPPAFGRTGGGGFVGRGGGFGAGIGMGGGGRR